MKNLIKNYYEQTIETINNLDTTIIEKICNIIINVYHNNGTVYICGNGGSGSIATHISSDFNNSLNGEVRKKINFVSLNDNAPLISAIANDVNYSEVFRYLLTDRITDKDVLIVISGSGNSPNILNACEYANKIGATTIGLTAYRDAKIKDMAKACLHLNLEDMQIAEDLFLSCAHLIFKAVKYELVNKN